MITLVWLMLVGYPGALARDTDAFTTKQACVAEVVRARQIELKAGLLQSDLWCKSVVLR